MNYYVCRIWLDDEDPLEEKVRIIRGDEGYDNMSLGRAVALADQLNKTEEFEGRYFVVSEKEWHSLWEPRSNHAGTT